ncbi:MAG: class I tRNA ligase family protein, partial [Bacillota bacterium]|nr:class I tRNA ligase family protein [Bacillota bacterium]
DWIQTTCPVCGGPARRETDTMPQWAGSSWYYLRYADTKNDKALADKALLDYWLPVDWYNGGMEHTTLHLLYSRFWHRFLYDIGVVGTKEPYQKRTSHGLILAEDGGKMSKSKGNVINPDLYTSSVGADALRLFEMFIGDFEKPNPWSDDGVRGARRYLDKVWQLTEMLVDGEGYLPELETLMHQTIKKVTYDYEHLKFNTAIAQLMTLLNEIRALGKLTASMLKDYLLLLNPVAPHITEEMWEMMNFGGELRTHSWPRYEEAKTVDSVFNMAISVNGKFKLTIEMPSDVSKDIAIEKAKSDPKIAAALEGKEIVKTIYVEKKMINFVIK